MTLEDFRAETRAWLEENCPAGVARRRGRQRERASALARALDRERLVRSQLGPRSTAAAASTTPNTWRSSKSCGGCGRRCRLAAWASRSSGQRLLELGTEDQKRRHLPPIVRGEVNWCQGYSEPSSGSDLASLRTRAVDNGDHFVINGQKIWTSGAQVADWMFALVRTDPDAPKHEGISFVLLTMRQRGVTVKPIRLISGSSPFCETFFDNAVARKDDLVGELNKGWTVGKRLLQFERGSMATLVGGAAVREAGPTLEGEAKKYLGVQDGRIADDAVRERVAAHNINEQAFRLTQRRTVEEAKDGRTPGPATSIFKMYGTELQQDKSSLFVQMRGTQGLGWEGDGFNAREVGDTRAFLAGRAASIYSGSNEIQRNIVAKRVLGLPD